MSRTQARTVAAQVLYQVDVTGEREEIEAQMAPWLTEYKVPAASREFAVTLVRGVLEHMADIDARIAVQARDWTLDRMNTVDRNLLRLALFEMFYCPETPQRVAVNEVVELAKRFSGEEASRFINGILHQLMDEAEKGS
jgi:N utilization substance protein B